MRPLPLRSSNLRHRSRNLCSDYSTAETGITRSHREGDGDAEICVSIIGRDVTGARLARFPLEATLQGGGTMDSTRAGHRSPIWFIIALRSVMRRTKLVLAAGVLVSASIVPASALAGTMADGGFMDVSRIAFAAYDPGFGIIPAEGDLDDATTSVLTSAALDFDTGVGDEALRTAAIAPIRFDPEDFRITLSSAVSDDVIEASDMGPTAPGNDANRPSATIGDLLVATVPALAAGGFLLLALVVHRRRRAVLIRRVRRSYNRRVSSQARDLNCDGGLPQSCRSYL